MSSPAVTVLMGAYNPHPRYLREAVESVLAQTFRDFELLIVEDPSESSAAEILAGFADPRIRIHRNETKLGLPESLNVGLRLARASLIARFDADDLCAPHRLERQVAFLEAHPEVDVYGSRILVVDENGRRIARRDLPLTHEEIARGLRLTNVVSHPSVMFRKMSVVDAGGYDPKHVEDFELWCRMITRGARFAASQEPLVSYRLHLGTLRFLQLRWTIVDMIGVKKRYFRGQLGIRDRLRILAERIMLVLPPRLVMWLFRRIVYRPL